MCEESKIDAFLVENSTFQICFPKSLLKYTSAEFQPMLKNNLVKIIWFFLSMELEAKHIFVFSIATIQFTRE